MWSSNGSHKEVREFLEQGREWGFVKAGEYDSHHLVAKSVIFDLITISESNLTEIEKTSISDRLPAIPLTKKIHEMTSDYGNAVKASSSIERIRQGEVFQSEGYNALFEDRCQDVLRAAKIFQIPEEVIREGLESAKQYKEVIKPILEHHVKRVNELNELNKSLCQGMEDPETILLRKNSGKPELGSGNTSQIEQAKELSMLLDKIYERDFQRTVEITQQQKALTAQGRFEEAWLTRIEHIQAHYVEKESSQIIIQQESILVERFSNKLDDSFRQCLEHRQGLVTQHSVNSPEVISSISEHLDENKQILKNLSEAREACVEYILAFREQALIQKAHDNNSDASQRKNFDQGFKRLQSAEEQLLVTHQKAVLEVSSANDIQPNLSQLNETERQRLGL